MSRLNDQEIKVLLFTCHDMEPVVSEVEFERMAEIITNYLKENHRSKGSGEIVRAFQMNLAGELDNRISHYGKWSLSYFSAIMIEWDIYRRKLIQTLDRKQPPPEVKEALVSDGQMYQATIEYCNLHNEWPIVWPWYQVFKHMEEIGKISMNLEERNDFFTRVKSYTMKFKGENESEYQERVRRECQKILVKKNLFPEGIEIKEPGDFVI